MRHVERLGSYLKHRVPALCQQYGKAPAQVPRISVDPIEKQHFILIPQYARQADINQLKLDVFRLKQKNPALAEQICIRLNALAMGQDLEVMELWAEIRSEVRTRTLQKTDPSLSPMGERTTEHSSQTATTTTISGTLADDFSASSPPEPALQVSSSPSSSAQQNVDEDVLKSERGIDYSKLRDLLKSGDWKAADEETYEVMLRAVGKSSRDLLIKDELLNFSCTDLLTIDRLWVKYSQGRFGFSVQKQIYVECGATLDGKYPSDKIWRRFGDRVGWRVDGIWITYTETTWDTSAPNGHLPFTPWLWRGWRLLGCLASRIQTCKL